LFVTLLQQVFKEDAAKAAADQILVAIFAVVAVAVTPIDAVQNVAVSLVPET